MNFKKKLSITFQKQHDNSDCGVACLSSVINYFGGKESLEKLREISGTSKQGTTLLGLFQGAQKCGFNAEGIEANLEWLKKNETPVILHVSIEERLQHYLVCYRYQNERFILGDPASGILEYTIEELRKIWKSNVLLKLIPNDEFKKKRQINNNKIAWFKDLIRDDLGLLSIVFVLSIILSTLSLSMAVFSQKLIDEILPEKNMEELVIGISILFLLLLMRGWLAYIAGFFGLQQSRSFNNRLIGNFYTHLLNLPKSFFDNRRIGELVSRMNDTSRIQSIIIHVFIELLNSFLLVIAGFVVLFIYSPEISLIALLSIPLYALISFKFHNQIVVGQRNVMTAEANKSSNYVNTMQGVDTIKAHSKESGFASLNKLIYGNLQDHVFLLGKTGVNLQLVNEVAGVLISISLLTIGSWLVFSERITVGILLAVLSIITSIFPAITSLVFANISIQGAKVAFDRMYEFTSAKPEFDKEKPRGTSKDIKFAKLKIDKLSFRFPGRKRLLKNVSASLNKGEIISILGESGGGKSTLLNILQGFYKPESGNLLLNGFNLNDIYIPDLRDMLGIVPQEVAIFNGNLLENLALGGTEEELKACVAFCQQTGFDRYFSQFPQSFATLLGEEGVNISGGQKQLIGICRALFRNPSLLLLDEPTASMDKNMERFSLSLIQKYSKNTGIILVTHQLNVANIADKIYILKDGTIQASGTQKDLLKSENLYSQMHSEIINVPAI